MFQWENALCKEAPSIFRDTTQNERLLRSLNNLSHVLHRISEQSDAIQHTPMLNQLVRLLHPCATSLMHHPDLEPKDWPVAERFMLSDLCGVMLTNLLGGFESVLTLAYRHQHAQHESVLAWAITYAHIGADFGGLYVFASVPRLYPHLSGNLLREAFMYYVERLPSGFSDKNNPMEVYALLELGFSAGVRLKNMVFLENVERVIDEYDLHIPPELMSDYRGMWFETPDAGDPPHDYPELGQLSGSNFSDFIDWHSGDSDAGIDSFEQAMADRFENRLAILDAELDKMRSSIRVVDTVISEQFGVKQSPQAGAELPASVPSGHADSPHVSRWKTLPTADAVYASVASMVPDSTDVQAYGYSNPLGEALRKVFSDQKRAAGKRVLKSMQGSDHPKDSDLLKRYTPLLHSIPFACWPDSLAWADTLRAEFPWMRDVVDAIERQYLMAQHLGSGKLFLRPLLLLGPVGLGKTQFVGRLGEVLRLPTTFVPLSGSSDNMMLKGMSRSWSGARPGLIVDTMVDARCPNPLVILDELDKVSTSQRNGRVWETLLALLEPSTSSKVLDEYLLGEVDYSSVNWVATANSLEELPAPLRSRWTVLVAGVPGADDFPVILSNLKQGVANHFGVSVQDLPVLHSDVEDTLRRQFIRAPQSLRKLRNLFYHLLELQVLSDKKLADRPTHDRKIH